MTVPIAEAAAEVDLQALRPPTYSLRGLLLTVTLAGVLLALMRRLPPLGLIALIVSLLMVLAHVLATVLGKQLTGLQSNKSHPLALRTTPAGDPEAPLDDAAGVNRLPVTLLDLGSLSSQDPASLAARGHLPGSVVRATALGGLLGGLVAWKFLQGHAQPVAWLAGTVACGSAGLLGMMSAFTVSAFWHYLWHGWTESAATASSFQAYRQSPHRTLAVSGVEGTAREPTAE